MLRQLFDVESCTYTYTYLITDTQGDCAIIVDPVRDKTAQYLTLIDELSLLLVAALDTHTHADHITGSGLLRQQTGCDIVMSSASEAQGITKRLNHKDTLTFGASQIVCLHTPGHTSDSCCFYSKEEGYLLTGDTLLIRGSGRTDFQQGNAQQAWHSIMTELMTLPLSAHVYPGHDYKGMTMSTLSEEKQFNPRLQVKSAEAYALLMEDLNLPYPKKIDEALPANLKCGLEK